MIITYSMSQKSFLKNLKVNSRKSNAYCYRCGKYVKIKEKLKCSKSCSNETIIIEQIRDPKRYSKREVYYWLNSSAFSVLRFAEELRMYVEYASMTDLQKWYCMSHQHRITAVHAIHFALIVSSVMPRYLSRSEN